MGVPIIENWMDLEGEVLAIEAAPDAPRFRILQVRVARAQPVEGFANLMAEAVGTVVRVHVANDMVEKAALAVGTRIACRVRRAGPHKVFAHPELLRVIPSR